MTVTELAERRKLLVSALRSGEYEQGYESLETAGPAGNKFCCLGVACRIAEKHGVPMTISQETLTGVDAVCLSFDENSGTLPAVVREWYGFTTDEGDFSDGTGLVSTLVRANDIEHLTFDQIADLIEAEPVGMFVAAA